MWTTKGCKKRSKIHLFNFHPILFNDLRRKLPFFCIIICQNTSTKMFENELERIYLTLCPLCLWIFPYASAQCFQFHSLFRHLELQMKLKDFFLILSAFTFISCDSICKDLYISATDLIWPLGLLGPYSQNAQVNKPFFGRKSFALNVNIKGDYESFRFGHKLKRLESRKWRLINGGKNESIVASSLEDLIENKTRLIYSGDEIKLFFWFPL